MVFVWFIRRVVGPIRQLAGATTYVSEGKWDAPLPQSEGRDEIAQLTAAFRPTQIFNAIMDLFGQAEAMVPPHERESAAALIHRLAGRRVLVVEDSELNRDVAVALLEDAGLTAEIAENGQSAVDMVTASPKQGGENRSKRL
jgi:hypothetical protein